MDKTKVLPGKIPIPGHEQTKLDEAIKLYTLVDSITAEGCDAEVKRVKGKLKVQKVRKSESTIID